MIGGEGIAVGTVFERPDAMDPPPTDPSAVRCDRCSAFDGQRRDGGRYRVLRFGLDFHPKGKIGRGRIARHIRLCDQCWEGLPR